LSIIELQIPPLKKRPEDIPLLIEHFFGKFSLINNKRGLKLDQGALKAMINYDWPGNVRELMNVIERCVILAENETITLDILPQRLLGEKVDDIYKTNMTLAEIEKNHIQQVLKQAQSQQEAAKILGIDPATLWRKKREYGIQ